MRLVLIVFVALVHCILSVHSLPLSVADSASSQSAHRIVKRQYFKPVIDGSFLTDPEDSKRVGLMMLKHKAADRAPMAVVGSSAAITPPSADKNSTLIIDPIVLPPKSELTVASLAYAIIRAFDQFKVALLKLVQ